jgi:hypothetical protein
MATIDYRHLLERLGGAEADVAGSGPSSGTLQFTGPVTAATVRRIASDADIIPVLPGGEGRCWISAAPRGFSRPTSARPSPPGTVAAPFPNARFRPRGAKPTTSATGHAEALRELKTERCCVPITTT